MEKKDLVKLLDEIFIPLDFKRKGNNWVFNGTELFKIINLQKSNYSNSFYVNYGYIIKNLKLTTTTHIENRLSSTNIDEQKRITDLLNLETAIPIDQRLTELKELIINRVIANMQSINTEYDLVNDLRNRSHLNNVPLIVKKYFNL